MAKARAADKRGQTPDKADNSDAWSKLNPRQRSFISEYLKDKNATAAYMRAYGVSRETAERAGPRLMGHVGVKAEIDRHLSAVVEQVKHETGITMERVLRELAGMAFASIEDIVAVGGKAADKRGALDMLMKHLGGYAKDNEQKPPAEKPLDRTEFARHLLFMLRDGAHQAANDPNKPAAAA